MRYWLMKSEPDTYSIDDLAKASEPAMWEGCRNYTVRNFFRDTMSDGDMAFFHHSNATPSGIVGTMRIYGDAFADPTQFDPASDYFDPKAPADGSRWICRNVQLVQKFKRMIPIIELREIPGLEGMLLLARGQRLSVMPVTPEEWEIINGLAGI
jgi:predicted RNA-binding protein with PUA-like domain